MIREFQTNVEPEEFSRMLNEPDIFIDKRVFMPNYMASIKRYYNEMPQLTLYNRVMQVKTVNQPTESLMNQIKEGNKYLESKVQNFNIYKETFILRINGMRFHLAPPIIELSPSGMVLVAGVNIFVSTKFPTIIVKTNREQPKPVLPGFISDNINKGLNPIEISNKVAKTQPSNCYFSDPDLSIVL